MASGPPPGIDLSADRQWYIIGPVIALMALATTAVIVRICIRITAKLPLKIDDYLIIAALVCSTPKCRERRLTTAGRVIRSRGFKYYQ